MAGEHRFSCVFCDIARTEASGKHMLIGVYSSDMTFEQFPGTTPISLWCRIEPSPPEGRHQFAVTLVHDGGSSLLEGELETLPGAPVEYGMAFPLPPVSIRMDGPGELVATISLDGAEPVRMGRVAVLAQHTQVGISR